MQQHQQQRVGTGRVIKPKKEIKDSDYKGFTRPRNYRNPKAEQKTPPKKSNKEAEFIHTRNFTNKSQTGGVQEQEVGFRYFLKAFVFIGIVHSFSL